MCLLGACFFRSREESEQKRKDRNLETDIINILYLYEVKDTRLVANMIMRKVKKYYKENKDGKN